MLLPDLSMAKRLHTEEEKCTQDRISQLQDELLIHILSLLTIKEAGRTSLLSTRWRDLWTFVPCLDLQGPKPLEGIQYKKRLRHITWKKGASWVNQVLGLNKSPTLQEFRVHYYSGITHAPTIYRWIRMALAKKVQRLELNFSDTPEHSLVSVSEEIIHHQQQHRSRFFPRKKQVIKNTDNCLKTLSLTFVPVGDDLLNYFLLSCPLLEVLQIRGSALLKKLELVGLSISLKHLEILSCPGITSFEIRDMGLVSLSFFARKVPKEGFLIEKAPQLVEVYFGGPMMDHPHDIVTMLSRCVPHVQILALSTCLMKQSVGGLPQGFNSLKQLVMIFPMMSRIRVLSLISLVQASPCLQKFVLKTGVKAFDSGELELVGRPHLTLKEIEYIGYCPYTLDNDYTLDNEVVMYLLQNAIALKKMVIDTRLFNFFGEAVPIGRSKEEQYVNAVRIKRHAEEDFEGKTPPGLELVIV